MRGRESETTRIRAIRKGQENLQGLFCDYPYIFEEDREVFEEIAEQDRHTRGLLPK